MFKVKEIQERILACFDDEDTDNNPDQQQTALLTVHSKNINY